VIWYGVEKPLVDNTTRANRAQNRRVVIKVLE
jgi:outer membrane protein OmpA-like peptidoglycan-associated protein